jgi:hypothetical protein
MSLIKGKTESNPKLDYSYEELHDRTDAINLEFVSTTGRSLPLHKIKLSILDIRVSSGPNSCQT